MLLPKAFKRLCRSGLTKFILFSLVYGAATGLIRAEDEIFSLTNPKSPVYKLDENSLGLFIDYPILVTGAAGVTTYAFVDSGIDGNVRRDIIKDATLGYDVTRPVFIWGHFTPLIGVMTMYGHGLYTGVAESFVTGSAILQAVALSAVYVSMFKFFTGRRSPHRTSDPNNFKPFALEFDLDNPRVSWPSGHTASIFTMVAAWHAAQPDNFWVPLFGYPVAAFSGWAMVDGNYHWASEAVSGALIGTAVGYYIGRTFRNRGFGRTVWQWLGTSFKISYSLD